VLNRASSPSRRGEIYPNNLPLLGLTCNDCYGFALERCAIFRLQCGYRAGLTGGWLKLVKGCETKLAVGDLLGASRCLVEMVWEL
jgi:hypothetical protein